MDRLLGGVRAKPSGERSLPVSGPRTGGESRTYEGRRRDDEASASLPTWCPVGSACSKYLGQGVLLITPFENLSQGSSICRSTGRNPIEHGRVMRSRWWNQPEHQPFRVTNFARPPRHGGSCAEPLAAKSLPVHPGPAGCSFPDGPEPGLRLSAGGQHQQAGDRVTAT